MEVGEGGGICSADVVESLARSAHCYYMGRGNDQKKMKTLDPPYLKSLQLGPRAAVRV